MRLQSVPHIFMRLSSVVDTGKQFVNLWWWWGGSLERPGGFSAAGLAQNSNG